MTKDSNTKKSNSKDKPSPAAELGKRAKDLAHETGKAANQIVHDAAEEISKKASSVIHDVAHDVRKAAADVEKKSGEKSGKRK